MNPSNLTRSSQPETLSRIGGAAQGGSAKPAQEREKLDREHGLEQEPGSASAAEDSGRPGSVGGNSNDNRSDQERASESDSQREDRR